MFTLIIGCTMCWESLRRNFRFSAEWVWEMFGRGAQVLLEGGGEDSVDFSE